MGKSAVFPYPKNHHCCLWGTNINYLDIILIQIIPNTNFKWDLRRIKIRELAILLEGKVAEVRKLFPDLCLLIVFLFLSHKSNLSKVILLKHLTYLESLILCELTKLIIIRLCHITNSPLIQSRIHVIQCKATLLVKGNLIKINLKCMT